MIIARNKAALFYLFLGLVFLGAKQVSAQCTICGAGQTLPFPDRKVIVEGANVATCAELEAEAAADASLCSGLTDFAFYCGCSDTPACSLCGEDTTILEEKENLVLTGLEPSWFPSNEQYTCLVAQGIVSLETSGDAACQAERDSLETIQQFCGCVAMPFYNCTTVCPDETLVDPAYRDVQALVEHPSLGYESFTCGELDLFASFGTLWGAECDAANYIGIKKCGCAPPNRPYCDLCEDGSVPADLSTNITYEMTCYEYAGDAYFLNEGDDFCNALKGVAGIYCGCDNPVASVGACRICDVPGGLVVPDSNRTLAVGDSFVDCGELEILGSDPTNDYGLLCEDMQDIGQEACCYDFTTVPEVADTSSPTTKPTLPPTAAPTAKPSAAPVAAATPPPTGSPTLAPVAATTPPPTTVPVASATPPPSTAPVASATPPPTTAPVAATTPPPTTAPVAAATPPPSTAPVAGATPAATPSPTTKPIDATSQPTELVQGAPPNPTASPTAKPTEDLGDNTAFPTAEPTAELGPGAGTGGETTSPPVVAGNAGDDCTICGPEVPLPVSGATIYKEGFENVTCSEMELAATLDDSLCPDLASFAFSCGCPDVEPTCTMCEGGGRIPAGYQDLVLNGMAPDWFPVDEDFTCGELERIISVAHNSTECFEDYEPFATLCGCYAPPDNNCTSLCPDGTIIDPLFSDSLIVENHPMLGTMTCSQFQLLVADGDLTLAQCDSANYAGIKYCGCQETISFCDICEDGSKPLFLEREITFAKTCLDHAGDGYLLTPDDALCQVYRATFGESCGCDNPIASADTCRICDAVGGVGVPDSNYTIEIDGEPIQCGELEFLANIPGSNFTCDIATALGEECCSVTMSPTAAPERCTVCRNGLLPFPERQIFGEGFENVTCGSLEARATANETLCGDLAQYEFYCGCADADSPCPLCVVGNSTPKESLVLKGYAPSWFPADGNYTCGVEAQLRSLQRIESQCSSATSGLEDVSTLCGCSVPESSSCSSLCPDGTLIDPSFNNVMVIENHPEIGNISCFDYQLLASSGGLTAAECDAAHYVGIKICGCNETRPFCDICEDGSVPSDLAKEVTFGKTCLDHAADAYFTNPNEDLCKAIQASYGEYCMCNNVLAGQDACRICPGGAAVANSNYTVRIGNFSVDCGNLEFTGNDPAAAFTCDHVRAFGPECCGPTDPPTSGPTSIATSSPTSAATQTPTSVDTSDPAPFSSGREGVLEQQGSPPPVPETNGALFSPTSGGKSILVSRSTPLGLVSFFLLGSLAGLVL